LNASKLEIHVNDKCFKVHGAWNLFSHEKALKSHFLSKLW